MFLAHVREDTLRNRVATREDENARRGRRDSDEARRGRRRL